MCLVTRLHGWCVAPRGRRDAQVHGGGPPTGRINRLPTLPEGRSERIDPSRGKIERRIRAFPVVQGKKGRRIRPWRTAEPVPPVERGRRSCDPSQPPAQPGAPRNAARGRPPSPPSAPTGPRVTQREDTSADTPAPPVLPVPPVPPAGPGVGDGSDPFVRREKREELGEVWMGGSWWSSQPNQGHSPSFVQPLKTPCFGVYGPGGVSLGGAS